MSVINVSLEDTFEQWRVKTNQISAFAGNQASLQTSSTNIVDAINEVRSKGPVDGTITTYGNLFQINIDAEDSAELILDYDGNLTLAGHLIADVTGNLNGNASTASKLRTARIISMVGDGTWNITFDGANNTAGVLSLNPTGVVPGTYTKFTVNGAGQIVSATGTWTTADMTAAFGYIPVSTSAGYADPSWITSLDAGKLKSDTSIVVQNVTATSRFFVPSGSQGNPSIAWTSDTGQDTGFYWGGDGYTYFTNNGVKTGEIQPGGNLLMVGNVTGYSDVRIKKDIETIKDALEKVNALRGVYYSNIDTNERNIGVIAQEVAIQTPELIKVASDGLLTVAYGNMAGLLLQAINELTERVKAIEERL